MGMRTLMNAVGLPDEHTRFDRKDHIKIHWENIDDSYLYLFALTSVEPDPNGTPYDYYSITHAPKDYVAKPGTITIETLDKQYQTVFFLSVLCQYSQNAWNISMEHLPNIEINLMFEDVIGNQKKPSKWDWKKICLMYKCDTCMGEKMEH
ncbi:astacin [Ancylostoma ceylanicum]|uniref:Metalloendopeptidase n=1 Tax=Ancylostoma ceylanicum TaxID=53326 RepID=A0A0D6M668_9BILA|nr:astacin [Ancylostoma ceylanicum]